ncbi:branched-chain amino acid ABC transporter permease [Truepera radiovictrix]|uniref:Inner-membrane translocator n=1 Tax=Truepera radiovictrix (strain DSM 17093 / CIP 108686 / LMG 22925 / RQ-24) TaxID=649638 RepID=D7CSP7_TRURR|nr:branched-chain amino acid ABC transporter permease [Truepera radiovictrix]ADI15467.1 inner-membrane translocator [Truepera radiovictrix DSM 17093]WMT55982.1 branched-chain amino acid ABC transporter permease [Truepera radiovictrix]
MAVNRWFQSGNYRRTYKEDQTIFASYSELASLIALLALLFWLPQAPFMTRSLFRLFDIALIYTVAVMGLNIVTGYAGQISIGQAAFMGVGAYTAAVLARDVGGPVLGFESTIPFWFAALLLPLGGAVAAAVGAFVGLPSLRLKHLYLAIATLAFQVIFTWSVGHTPWLNQGGSIRVPRVSFFGEEIRGSALIGPFYYYFALVVVIILAVAMRNLLRSKFGRALVAVRDNDRAADAMGIDPGRTKVMAFAIAGFYAGVAGALLALYDGSVIIESFTLGISINFLAMAIVGGLGTMVGSLIGPAFLTFLDPWVESFAGFVGGFMPATIDVATAMRPTVFGLIIVLFLIFEPRGLANWWRLLRQYAKRWPFRY